MQQFLSFLGQIGIDPKLLIAQIINFALLLWILNKFVYKSIVKRIEDDEKDLQKAKIMQENLDAEKEKFLKQKNRDSIKAKQSSREKIAEAGTLAEKIKSQAREEAQKERSEMLIQMKKQLTSRQANLKNEQLQKVKQQIFTNIQAVTAKFSRSSDSISTNIQKYFLADLPEKIADFPAEAFHSTSPRIILETANPLTGGQLKPVQKMISAKFTRPVKIKTKTNSDLIGGYRLEINGLVVENNLLNEILHATETV